ncbi:hypothetical protein ABKV19_003485 [Rosa sericea]
MIRRTTSYSNCSISSRRGMPFLHSSTTLVALFHSQSSNPTKSRDPPSMPKVTNVKQNGGGRSLYTQCGMVTFNTLVKGFCMMGNNTAAIQLLRKMEGNGCEPNIVSYSTIIDSLGKDTLVVDAMNLFSEMIRRRIAPDLVTYNSLINGVCKLGKWKEGTRLLNGNGRSDYLFRCANLQRLGRCTL